MSLLPSASYNTLFGFSASASLFVFLGSVVYDTTRVCVGKLCILYEVCLATSSCHIRFSLFPMLKLACFNEASLFVFLFL
mmetsp:Transcript_13943/g.21103  ORF Transcript_13943/g.21103 Transcript_13943/m.21103 type:complete len:80 (-) Transcript_13943:236-475(-)